jgi:hypothetical protein
MESLDLVGQQQLTVHRLDGRDTLRLYRADGRLTLTVTVTPDGPVLEVAGGDLLIRSDGQLGIDAEHLSIRGRRGIEIQSGGDVVIRASGVLRTTASSQQLTASHGDVHLTANDDVRLDGERVRMNC